MDSLIKLFFPLIFISGYRENGKQVLVQKESIFFGLHFYNSTFFYPAAVVPFQIEDKFIPFRMEGT